MIQNLTSEQIAYLKALDSKKKRRKFMLDCLVESVLGESMKFEEEINRLNVVYQKSTAPATLKGLLQFCGVSDEQMSKSVFRESANKETQHLESIDFDFNFSLVNAMRECADKSNFTTEEVDMAKNLMTEREKVSEKKWTDEDMRVAFFKGRTTLPKKAQGLAVGLFPPKDISFKEWFDNYKSLKNE